MHMWQTKVRAADHLCLKCGLVITVDEMQKSVEQLNEDLGRLLAEARRSGVSELSADERIEYDRLLMNGEQPFFALARIVDARIEATKH